MKYEKPWLTFEEQADQLIQRGLIADPEVLRARLQAVSYYRLSGYLYPFRKTPTTIQNGITLEFVWKHYTFDRRLRMMVMDAIERVEVGLKTQLVYLFAQTYGPFAYLDKANFPSMPQDRYLEWVKKLENEVGRSREVFLDHFKERYGDCHAMPPLWMLCEVMSFGAMRTFFEGVHPSLRGQIAKYYHVPDKVLSSWIKLLGSVRNVCAHHGRLWNRVMDIKALLPEGNKYPNWDEVRSLQRGKMFLVLTVLRFLLRTAASTSGWDGRLRKLIRENPEVSPIAMGFPAKWEELRLWA